MNIKRIVSGLILFPIVAIIMIYGNKYVVDSVIAVIAIMSIHEFYKAFYTSNKAKPITWLRLYCSSNNFYNTCISKTNATNDNWNFNTYYYINFIFTYNIQ